MKKILLIGLSLSVLQVQAGSLLKKGDEKAAAPVEAKESAEAPEGETAGENPNDPVAQLLSQKGIVKKLLLLIWDKLSKLEAKIDAMDKKISKQLKVEPEAALAQPA